MRTQSQKTVALIGPAILRVSRFLQVLWMWNIFVDDQIAGGAAIGGTSQGGL